MPSPLPHAAPPQRPPLSFFVLSMAATPFLVGGIVGLTAPTLFPPLADPAVAWALLAVGVVFELWSAAVIIGHVRRQGRRS